MYKRQVFNYQTANGYCRPAVWVNLNPTYASVEVTAPAEAVEYNSSVEPVSYTHLDVYKRQGQETEPIKPSDNSSDGTQTEKIIGTVIVVCILAGSVAFFIFKQKSK